MVNIMSEYVGFTEKCFHKYLKLIFDKEYDKNIANSFIESYIEIRYSDYLDEENTKTALNKKIAKALDDTMKSLVESNDSKMTDKIRHFRKFADYFFGLDQLYFLESQKRNVEKISLDRKRLLGLEDDKFVSVLYEMIRVDIKKKKDYLDSFDSNTFSLKFKKISKNDIGVSLENNIVFPDLYSELAINKVASRDNISEDMCLIAFLLTSRKIITDLAECNFGNNYFVHLTTSFFGKKVKLNRIINVIDNDYIQERLRIVITYQCFVKYKSYIMEYTRQGFVFAIYLDDSFDYSSENIEFLEVFDKILLDSSKYYYKDMKNNVKIRSRIINVDEVK